MESDQAQLLASGPLGDPTKQETVIERAICELTGLLLQPQSLMGGFWEATGSSVRKLRNSSEVSRKTILDGGQSKGRRETGSTRYV